MRAMLELPNGQIINAEVLTYAQLLAVQTEVINQPQSDIRDAQIRLIHKLISKCLDN